MTFQAEPPRKRRWPCEGLRGRPVEEDVWVCPVCFCHRKNIQNTAGLPERDPVSLLMAAGYNILEGVERAATMCFGSKKHLLDHMEAHHEIMDGHRREFNDLFSRHRVLEADGLLQRYIQETGARHALDINSFWGTAYDGVHHMRDCYNAVVVASRGMAKRAAEYETRFRPDVITAKEIWAELKHVHESGSDSEDDSFINDGDPFDDFESTDEEDGEDDDEVNEVNEVDEVNDDDGSPPRKRRAIAVILSDTESLD